MSMITDSCDCLKCENRCSFFQNLSDYELISLNESKIAYRYKKGEVIFKRGTYHPYITLISEGYVKTIVESGIQKRFLLEIITPRNFVNNNFFGDNIIKYTLVALTEATVCFLNIQTFSQLLVSNGQFTFDILKYLNINSCERMSRLASISLKQTRGKVADTLMYIRDKIQDKNVQKLISRRDLAEMANISTENAIRTLKEFEEEKLIRLNKKEIEILDEARLNLISQKG